MDLETLILILFFIVFPIIQQIAEARRRAKAPPPVELERDEEEDGPDVERPRRIRLPAPVESGSPPGIPGGANWSDEWGSWPGSDVTVGESDDGREDASAEVPVLVVNRRPAPVSLEERGEREIVLRDRSPRSATLEVDRATELEELMRARARALPPPSELQPRVPALRIGPPPAFARSTERVAAGSAIPEHPRLALLRGGSPEQLREAFILSEILNPPRAERDFG